MNLIATGASVRVTNDKPDDVISIHAVAGCDTKRRGEATEAEFIARACGFNFRIAKPWGDSDSYDVLVGLGRGFWRVQVKRAPCRKGQFMAKTGGHTRRYTKENIDFIAAHVVRENIWYIVPVEAFVGVGCIHFRPGSRRQNKYEKYREAWCLLACEPKGRGWKDIPVLCRFKDLPVCCAVCPQRRNESGRE